MLRVIDGDLFDLKVQVLVNPVNCVGVMGKGLAKQFKDRFPYNYWVYKKACLASSDSPEKLLPGGILVVEIEPPDSEQDADYPYLRYIFNAATKGSWSESSQLGWIRSIARNICNQMLELDMKTIAIPALGCGNGGLNWDKDIKPILINTLSTPALENRQVIILNPVKSPNDP